MKIKAIILVNLIFIALVHISCREKIKVEIKENNLEANQCFTKGEREEIIKTIIETSDFQMFLHPNVKGRLPVQLVKNEFVTSDLKIKSNGYQVIFRDSLILPEGTIHRIRMEEEDCKSKKVTYSVFYPVEGAILTGTIVKSDTKWMAENTNWGIKD
ncbi:hypothetical protein [Arenibacter palladensis]|uniref:hypothetical protein n=1 Tax=Arenibacter palladensis TaxID=237373 RepID=UPI0026E44A25|nr:hypothetical protein [Arenibacter palladensis]MDO6602288.1 hypothetical protein [Arenibacter palladensis]